MGETNERKERQALPGGDKGRLRTSNGLGRAMRLSNGDGPRITWEDIPESALRTFITDVCRVGGAVILGQTSDGGALSLTIMLGDNRIKEWPASALAFELVARLFREQYVLPD